MNRTGMWAVCMVVLSVAGTALAQDDAKPKKQFSEKQLAQQQRMKDCSAEAKSNSLAGDDRKAFMKTCLSGGSVTAAAGSEQASAPDDKRAVQREKMKTCNAEAKTQALKGDARKEFMSTCLAQ